MLIDVELLKENEDGSAVYSFNLSEDMKDAFVRFGITQAIKAGIEAAKELQPDFDNDWTPEDMAYRPGGLAQPEQEPVLQDIEQYRMQIAGICTAAIGYWKEGDSIHPAYDTLALRDVAKLYAKYDALYKAPQREWVGLTGEEIINMSCGDLHYAALMGDVVRKLKEKNT